VDAISVQTIHWGGGCNEQLTGKDAEGNCRGLIQGRPAVLEGPRKPMKSFNNDSLVGLRRV
jgi:hypothetical protein